jgi:hypothetical protein
MSGSKSVPDEVEKTSFGKTWDHVEGHQCVTGADHVFVVGIKDAEIILRPEVGSIRNFVETEGRKPVVDFLLGDGDDVEAWLGGNDAQVPGLGDDPFKAVESRNEQVVKIEPFKILERGGLPKMETAGILGG